MLARSSVGRIGSTAVVSRAPIAQIERFDRLIREAEARLDEQSALVRQASLVGGNTASADFDLAKMHLLLAILREAKERVAASISSPRQRGEGD
jgi:hypothetical protein